MAARNVIEVAIVGTNMASGMLDSLAGTFGNLGKNIAGLGAQITAVTAPLAVGLGAAVSSAVTFDETMTNVGAILGKNREEMVGLNDQILAIGMNSRDGPQAAAEAFYDIVGGVADASTHMAILEQSIATAEAGAAGLGGTTSALISVMNAYGYSADQAGFASDVLTRTVGMGVGTMDEFASAMPQATSLAAQLGVTFGEVGASMAYMTTKGFSASVSSTKLTAAMTAFIKPNKAMTDALALMGYESGSAAIKQLGLTGTIQAFSAALGGSTDDMAAALGSTEALSAALILGDEAFSEFSLTFREGLEGATDAARALQLESPAAQMDLLKSQLQGIGITIGQQLLPSLNWLIATIRPMLNRVFEWMKANPKLTATITGIAAAAVALGPILIAVGSTIAFIASPIGLVIAALGALGAAWATDFGNIRSILGPTLSRIGTFFSATRRQLGIFIAEVRDFGFVDAFKGIFGQGDNIETKESLLEGWLTMLGMDRDRAIEIVDSIWSRIDGIWSHLKPLLDQIGIFLGNLFQNVDLGDLLKLGGTLLSLANPLGWIKLALEGLFDIDMGDIFATITDSLTTFFETLNSGGNVGDALGAVFGDTELFQVVRGAFEGVATFVVETLIPALRSLADWFLTTALPAIVGFVTGTVVPAVGGFFEGIATLWTTVLQPALQALYDWFVTTALPAITNFIQTTVVPIVQGFIDVLGGIWLTVQPALQTLYDWFITVGLPFIQEGIQFFVDTYLNPAIELLRTIWEIIQPGLQQVYDYFITNGLPFINDALDWFLTNILNPVIDVIRGIWETVGPPLQSLFDWFITNGLPLIQSAIQWWWDNILTPVINVLKGIWEAVGPGLESFKTGIAGVFNWIRDNVIQPIITLIETVIGKLGELSGGLGAYGGVAQNASTIGNMVGSGQVGVGDVAGAAWWAFLSELGFQQGGYTGDGPATQVAGVTHGQEYVVPKDGALVLRNDGENSQSRIVNIYFQGTGGPGSPGEADDAGYMITQALRSRGVEV